MGLPSPTTPSLTLFFHPSRGKLLAFLIASHTLTALCCRSSVLGSDSWDQSSLSTQLKYWDPESLCQLTHRMEVPCQKEQKEKTKDCPSHQCHTCHLREKRSQTQDLVQCFRRDERDHKNKDLHSSTWRY